MARISIDTETTGVDLYHGAKPFFVSICQENGQRVWWQWPVNPLTRQPEVLAEDLREIRSVIREGDPYLILQNSKFDVTALGTLDPWLRDNWNWERTYDTLIAGHLLASNLHHDLTSMAKHYLGEDILSLEKELQQACNEARRYCRSNLQDWRIAKKDLEDTPSARDSSWKHDFWLPRQVALQEGYESDHPWMTVLSRYTNTDSAVTLALWQVQEAELKRRGLWQIFLERMKVVPIALSIERKGVTISGERLGRLEREYREESQRLGRVCKNLASCYCYSLDLPKSGNNQSLRKFLLEVMKLPPLKRSQKTGGASLDYSVMEMYEEVLPERSRQLAFIRALSRKRKLDTALTYMAGYRHFWIPHSAAGADIPLPVTRRRYITGKLLIIDQGCAEDWYVIHPSLNPTGTHTLRWSSKNPNEQNISKREGFNLRYTFGPAPGREWWALDAENLELRIPAYRAEEKEMIDLFERPDKSPYYGSYHLLIAHILHPREFEECLHSGNSFKERYRSTLYQWVKNGNFAVQYGAVKSSGTADRAYHLEGAQEQVQQRFQRIKRLNDRMISFAERHGYIETIPDRSVDPKHGYPLLCSRTEQGRILPTIPLNYFVQGTACWWMMRAMIRCQQQLDDWQAEDGFDGYMTMQVHDELVLDLPRNLRVLEIGSAPVYGNLNRVLRLKQLMEQCGDDLGIPIRVGIEYHSESWSQGVSIKTTV